MNLKKVLASTSNPDAALWTDDQPIIGSGSLITWGQIPSTKAYMRLKYPARRSPALDAFGLLSKPNPTTKTLRPIGEPANLKRSAPSSSIVGPKFNERF